MKFSPTLSMLAVTAALWTGVAMSDDKIPASLAEGLKKLVPSQEPSSVVESPVKGIYEVAYGGEVFYITADANYLLQGEMIDLANRVNLTENRQNAARMEIVKGIKDDQMVVFKPKGDVKHVVTVFTDIDCPYCRKMHAEMDDYLAAGIEVRYALYPRAGIGSPSYDKLVNVWCADDRNDAMTKAKTGGTVEAKTCDNPVKDHFALGHEVGVTGTPAILTGTGHLLPGYRPAKDLAQVLEQLAAAK